MSQKTLPLLSAVALTATTIIGSTVVATAQPQTGTVTVIRTVRGDSSATPVAGIPLSIYIGSSTTGKPAKKVISAAKPIALTLPVGQYTITEPGVGQYTSPQDRGKIPLTFVVSPNSPANIIYAGSDVVDVRPEADGGVAVPSGGKYKVSTCNGNPIATLTPDGSPSSHVTHAPKGCIKVSTMVAPRGTTAPPAVTQQTASNGATIIPIKLHGTPQSSAPRTPSSHTSVTLRTLIRGTRTPIVGNTYQFADCSTNTVKARATTGDKGVTTFTLPAGCYRIKQVKAQPGFDRDVTEQEFTASGGHVDITATNRRTGDTAQPVSEVPIVGTSDQRVNATARIIGGKTPTGVTPSGSPQVSSIPAGAIDTTLPCALPTERP